MAGNASAGVLPLSKLTSEFGEHVIDQDSGLPVFHIRSSHVLIQAAGYLKYNLAVNSRKGVFFRGQTQLYKTLSPSLFRNARADSTCVKYRKHLNDYLQSISNDKKALRNVDCDYHEPLLQHYGVRTTWLDVVDNVWVALWFACYAARSVLCGNEEYLHFEKRIQTHGKLSDIEYVYILLLESAYFDPLENRPGYYRDARSETVDLRVAVPSQFVRPHAQHGVLVRGLSKTGLPSVDCGRLHVGTIRCELTAALDWLGSASTLTCHALFPPAFYDFGYRQLLEHVHPKDKCLGLIHRIQA